MLNKVNLEHNQSKQSQKLRLRVMLNKVNLEQSKSNNRNHTWFESNVK